MMRNILLLTALSLVARPGQAARTCSSATNYQYRVLEARYDGPDPIKNNSIATVAVSLSSSSTPLYECVAQWPEAWAGFYPGHDGGAGDIIWSDCIWTGAGFGADKTVSFAADWNTKTVYISHTFTCSDRQGTDGLATGSTKIDFACSTYEDDASTYCVPKAATAGTTTRPDLRISTAIVPPTDTAPTCANVASRYQSWKIEGWIRRYELVPGSVAIPGSPDDALPKGDTGPSFTLRDLAGGGRTFSCASETWDKDQRGVFEGVCEGDGEGSARFEFDPKLNLVRVAQGIACEG